MLFKLQKNSFKTKVYSKKFFFLPLLSALLGLSIEPCFAQSISVKGMEPNDMTASVIYYAFCADKTTSTDQDTAIAACNSNLFDGASNANPGAFLDDQNDSLPYRYIDTQGTTIASDWTSDLVTFQIEVDSSVSASSGNQLVVSLYSENEDADDSTIIPIVGASVDSVETSVIPTDCSTYCQSEIGSTNTFRAVRVSAGSYIRVSFLMTDLCSTANGSGEVGKGCDGGTPKAPTTYDEVIQQGIYVVYGEVSSTATTGSDDYIQSRSAGSEEAEIEFRFTHTAQTISCPSPEDMYFPSDSAIIVQNSNINAAQNVGLAAPFKGFMVLASQGSTDASYSGYNSNSVIGRTEGDLPSVQGFTNTTTGTDNQYELRILARDYAGIISAPATSGGTACTVTGATTSTISGLISDGECFIASGTFRDIRNPSLELLREFRDQVLLQSNWGRKFVQFYYSHGPKWAQKLVEYPILRVPMFLFLFPLQALAFLILNPLIGFTVLGICVLGFLFLYRSRVHA